MDQTKITIFGIILLVLLILGTNKLRSFVEKRIENRPYGWFDRLFLGITPPAKWQPPRQEPTETIRQVKERLETLRIHLADKTYLELLSSTSGWKTYQNSYYGFSIQYPGEGQILMESGQFPQSDYRKIIVGDLFNIELSKSPTSSYVGYEPPPEKWQFYSSKENCSELFLGNQKIPTVGSFFGEGTDIIASGYNIVTRKNKLVKVNWLDGVYDLTTIDPELLKYNERGEERSPQELKDLVIKRVLRLKMLRTLTFDNPEDQPVKVTCQIYP